MQEFLELVGQAQQGVDGSREVVGHKQWPALHTTEYDKYDTRMDKATVALICDHVIIRHGHGSRLLLR
jgi:hypothetical protein